MKVSEGRDVSVQDSRVGGYFQPGKLYSTRYRIFVGLFWVPPAEVASMTFSPIFQNYKFEIVNLLKETPVMYLLTKPDSYHWKNLIFYLGSENAYFAIGTNDDKDSIAMDRLIALDE